MNHLFKIPVLPVIFVTSIIFSSCKKEATLPAVSTASVSDITQTTATSGGDVTGDGGAEVTARGVCWSTSENPTISNNITTNGKGTGTFTSNLTELTPGTRYYVRAYATNEVGTAYGNRQTFVTGEILSPTLTTDDVSSITQTTAVSGGNITDNGGGEITARGVCWSTCENPTTADSHTDDGTGTGTFTSNLTGLSPGTTYYVRAYATNSSGTAYGNEVSFDTNPVLLATLTTDPASSITQTTAVSGGNITDDGGADITARGVCWSTSENPTTADSHTNDGTGMGTYTSNITGLTPGTTYYVRAYATNSTGTAYGNQEFFDTDPVLLATLTTDPASSITQTTAVSGGNITDNGGGDITARGVCWSTSQNPTTADSHTDDGTGTGTFTSNLTGLSPGTTYFVRAYATNSAGTAYGNEISFDANPVLLATLTTDAVGSITRTTAVSGGNITDSGGGDITARGVCWSTSQNPTTTDNHTDDGTGTGTFTSNLTGLTPGTTYYVRAYATNSAGTAYGNEVFFDTNPITLATLTTDAVGSITQTTAMSGGNITDNGGAAITARGVCWSTSQNSTTADSHTEDGTGTGSFTSTLDGLNTGTTYYVRAYAINSEGTAYGNEESFTTVPLTDSEGNVYETVYIGTQLWMAENLAYLPSVSPSSAESSTDPYYYVYGYEGTSVSEAKATSNYETYGVLYNWPAATDACPDGWHLPSDDEWKVLEMYLGMSQEQADISGDWRGTDEGGKLKETGTSHWLSPNTGATNESGFTALPGGACRHDVDPVGFYLIGTYGPYWASTSYTSDRAYYRELNNNNAKVWRHHWYKKNGFSVRCIKD